jgi:prepilin-type N-terminal cleavage/methylation domain-containing protein
VRRRLRRQEGFGLVELVIAMTILAIGLLALMAAFSSGYAAINRASEVGTASVLADKQMETLRAMSYATIETQPADSTESVVGPDGRTYSVRTTRSATTITGGREVQLVDVYVSYGSKEVVHEQSTFDELTGS